MGQSSSTLMQTLIDCCVAYDNAWLQVPYPLISLVSRMPMTLYGRCPLTIHTRTFETILLSFTSEKDAIDVFESVKELTVASAY